MGDSEAPPSIEPLVRSTAFFGVRAAVLERWGAEGLRAIEHRVDDSVRAIVGDRILSPQTWLPERHLIELCEAVLRGPAAGDETDFRECVTRSVFHGWGRFQRLILQLVSPSMLANRAPAFWRRDHTHGQLEIEVGEGRGTIWLADSPYCETEFARLLIAETFRAIVEMMKLSAGARTRETHALDRGRRLVIELSWDDADPGPPSSIRR